MSHDHRKQFFYVQQSLVLWRDISKGKKYFDGTLNNIDKVIKKKKNRDMFKLWYLSEQDLLNPTNKYVLKDTGQGIQRVQDAPLVRNASK